MCTCFDPSSYFLVLCLKVKESESDPLISVENGTSILSDGVAANAAGWNSNKDLQAQLFTLVIVLFLWCSDEDVAAKDSIHSGSWVGAYYYYIIHRYLFGSCELQGVYFHQSSFVIQACASKKSCQQSVNLPVQGYSWSQREKPIYLSTFGIPLFLWAARRCCHCYCNSYQ